MGHMTITACFSGEYGSLEIRNGNEYGLYKIVQIINGMIPNSNEQRDGLVVNLRNNFEINARNGEQKNIILGVKVIQRNSGNVVFQKQVDNFGSIRVKN
jgi:preprotein translocase subunit SecB